MCPICIDLQLPSFPFAFYAILLFPFPYLTFFAAPSSDFLLAPCCVPAFAAFALLAFADSAETDPWTAPTEAAVEELLFVALARASVAAGGRVIDGVGGGAD